MLIAFISAAMITLYFFAVAPNAKRRDGDAYLQKYYAHRGLHDDIAPENSLAALERARDAGYGMELDVRPTADGALVVFHDERLMRMCGVDGALEEIPYMQLESLRLLGTDEGIPLFREILERIDGEAPLLIELKHGLRNRALVDETLTLLSGYRGAYLIESFSPAILYRVRRRAPHILRGQLVGRVDKNLRGMKRFLSILLTQMLLNFLSRPDFIAYDLVLQDSWQISLQRAIFGVKTAAWTVRSEEDRARIEDGCDLMIFENFLPNNP